MDRSTKSYIDQLVAPLLARIDSLERSNEALSLQVRHLESLLHSDRPYQKPTSTPPSIQFPPPTT